MMGYRVPPVWCAVVFLTTPISAATYYVDFVGGNDANNGASPDAAFKHCPGDRQADGAAKTVNLAAGDVVIFKGGVAYRGAVDVSSSGTEDARITFDGNSAGAFGVGKAIIDGGARLAGWRRCASADEAKGNPRWKEIFYADVPEPYSWRTFNLCDQEKPLPIAQDPNPSDPFFQENIGKYYRVDRKMAYLFPGKIYFEEGAIGNSSRPLILALSKRGGSAVVEPLRGGAFTIELQTPVTVTALGIMPQPRYAPVKDVAFYGDGKELLTATLQKDLNEVQKFDLPKPATFRKLTVKLLSAHEGAQGNWTAIAEIAAYDAQGNDVLDFDPELAIRDEKLADRIDPEHFKGVWVGIHCGNNIVSYQQVRGYDPASRTLRLELYGGKLYEETRYCFYNYVRLIDKPGEYSIEPTENLDVWRVFHMPERLVNGLPADIAYSEHGHAFAVAAASHVTIQGFVIRRQGGRRPAGVAVRDGKDVVIRDCEVTLVNGGSGITALQVDNILVDSCFVHHCPGHTKGILLHNCANAVSRNCRLVKNTSTALDYYGCIGGKVLGTLVTDHYGMHANGLTFYLGCKNLVIEGNQVYDSNIGLTIQDAENVIIRNNIIDSGGKSLCVGIWTATPLRNVQFLNNLLLRASREQLWHAAMFSNNRGPEGLVVRNNVIDGLSGNLPGQFTHNIYTRWGPNQQDHTLGPGEIYEPDLKRIFVDPENRDFRLRAGSPAIDAGGAVEGDRDFSGQPRPRGAAVDIGPHEYDGS